MPKIKGPNGLVFDFPETLAAALLRDRAAYELVDDVESLEKPVDKASKNDWAAFAVQAGVDVTGMTKADIQAAVAALEESNGDDPAVPTGTEGTDGTDGSQSQETPAGGSDDDNPPAE